MKRISIDKHDGIAEVIDRVLAIDDDEVLLVIPKGSDLGKSASNFRLLKRESDSADKKVILSTTDEIVRSLAGEHGLIVEGDHEDHNLLAAKSRSGAEVSDILPHAHDAQTRKVKRGPSVKLNVPAVHDDEDDEEEAPEVKSMRREEAQTDSAVSRFFNPKAVHPAPAEDADDDSEEDSEPRKSSRALIWIIGILIVAVLGGYAATTVLGRAQVSVTFSKTPWNYQANFTADKSATDIDSTSNIIPAQIFNTQKNITEVFPASSRAGTVGVRATGNITIYNNFGSDAQELVATTRFVTPDGKVFRLVHTVSVPGKTATGPGAIDAPIVADQPGPSYNIGPISKLTIPGFAKGPRFTAFWGEIKSPLSGGFVGTRPVTTAADVANAKSKTTALLQEALQNGITTSYPNHFKILDGATSVSITKLVVSTSTDQNGNFSVFGEATLQAIGFDESAFEQYLLSLAQGAEASSTFSSINVSYGNVQANFSKGQVSFSLTAQGALEPSFSTDSFARSVAGKSVSDARSVIASLPQLSNGSISVWPIWLWNMPSDPARINVNVD